jgi:hypothetical protein
MEFKLDYAGLGEYMRTSPELQEALLQLAKDGVEKIRPHAPVGDPAIDPHPGAYKESLHAEVGMGVKQDRLGSRIVASVDHAAAEEWGNAHRRGSRFLGKTALEILNEE